MAIGRPKDGCSAAPAFHARAEQVERRLDHPVPCRIEHGDHLPDFV